MKTIIFPEKTRWNDLCRRPVLVKSDLDNVVREIIEKVKSGKDEALYELSEKFDGVKPDRLKVTKEEILESESKVPEDIRKAILAAKVNIEKFHSPQLYNEPEIETSPGVKCRRKNVAIEKVGLYIPGGSAPLFSTVLMLGIPARLAGCREIVICSPPDKKGKTDPLILYTAGLLGITEIFRAGGAQAIAAMAYGTTSIPAVHKIFGPGNQFVTKAKELVQQDGVAIDMPAGPSEVLVISDGQADPGFIASDLLSQAEHGADSQVLYLTDSREMLDKVSRQIELQLADLPRKEIAGRALMNSRLILLHTLDQCMEFSNYYAPEHLIINTSFPEKLAEMVTNAGSVFLGQYSCESAGDYASGTNHTLPTNGYARNFSGVSADSFIRKITFQTISREGIRNLGPVVEKLAGAELLSGHRNAVSIRLKSLEND